MQCNAVHSSAVQCSAMQCSAVQCSAVQCSAVQCIPFPVEWALSLCLRPTLCVILSFHCTIHWPLPCTLDTTLYTEYCSVQLKVNCTLNSALSKVHCAAHCKTLLLTRFIRPGSSLPHFVCTNAQILCFLCSFFSILNDITNIWRRRKYERQKCYIQIFHTKNSCLEC